MRISLLLILICACVMIATPAAAQKTPVYQPPTKSELKKLRAKPSPKVVQVRAGQVPAGLSLTPAERAQIAAAGNGQTVVLLRDLKGGRHGHVWWDNWVWYFLVPGVATTLVLFIVIIIIVTI